MDNIKDLRAELYTLNAERFGLETRVAELEAENEGLLALSNASIAKLTELATQPLHRIVATRLALNALVAGLAVQNNEHVQSFVAFPKFVAGRVGDAAVAVGAKLPRVRVEWPWLTAAAQRRTSRLGPAVS